MSSPNLNVMISVGGLLSYLSLPLWGAEAFSNNAERLATAVCTVSGECAGTEQVVGGEKTVNEQWERKRCVSVGKDVSGG